MSQNIYGPNMILHFLILMKKKYFNYLIKIIIIFKGLKIDLKKIWSQNNSKQLNIIPHLRASKS